MNILIVEDHPELAQEIVDYLSKNGYLCKWAKDCETALEELSVNSFDAMLLDLGLPDGSGFDVLKGIRKKQSDIAVVIITARGELDDRINGLQLGADDYLTKPFALTELGARLQAIIRRMHGFAANVLDIHGFKLQLQDYKVSFNENPIALTKKEFDIFRYLALNKNRVITRLQLTEHIWGDILEINSDSNFIDVHVRNLRKKLDKFATLEWFETVRNVGYRINL
ncbi:DNA-binding response regulator [Flavobacterium noncentrifugens]|uniref:DNA-binding response regulator, OmpR family, contains REC and winged-helix (WHTH) domain n=1 Tax=Flavobacterium noncentrifugens TaxID=1128970 RepID=A0A1G8RZU0_9FLAO|nr:response regulator transcription factor [Flavobacterium noncentrifugens]GEP49646.1 DNA-binding response regulator [Flavobacterium noncentrifugens]SDJ22473.1 DNA-binding response regulator, OmpR family, contains REC and winged-helix (wHTH) domain [Flavobacterium noncentrifugens]